MKKIVSFSIALLLLQGILCLVLSPIVITAQTQEILTNQAIVDLVKTGISDPIIISMIKSSKNSFNTTSTEVVELKKLGVSDAVILEMVQSNSKQENQTSNITSEVSTQTNSISLPDGTPVKMRIGRTVSSKDAKTGETVDFEVLEDIKIGETIIISRGAIALATVTRAKPRGRLGKGGKLDVNIDSVRLISGEKIPLRAVKESKGGSHTGAMTGAIVASSILFFPAAPFFLLMKGKDITIPKGTEITAYVNGDISLNPTKFDQNLN